MRDTGKATGTTTDHCHADTHPSSNERSYYDCNMSTDIQAAFEAALQRIPTLTQRPDNNTLLQLYALYKQAT